MFCNECPKIVAAEAELSGWWNADDARRGGRDELSRLEHELTIMKSNVSQELVCPTRSFAGSSPESLTVGSVTQPRQCKALGKCVMATAPTWSSGNHRDWYGVVEVPENYLETE